MNDKKKTRRVGIICQPVGPTQAEIQQRIQEYFNDKMVLERPIRPVPFKFPENPDALIITNPDEFEDK